MGTRISREFAAPAMTKKAARKGTRHNAQDPGRLDSDPRNHTPD